jgi:hypothetical protein
MAASVDEVGFDYNGPNGDTLSPGCATPPKAFAAEWQRQKHGSYSFILEYWSIGEYKDEDGAPVPR